MFLFANVFSNNLRVLSSLLLIANLYSEIYQEISIITLNLSLGATKCYDPVRISTIIISRSSPRSTPINFINDRVKSINFLSKMIEKSKILIKMKIFRLEFGNEWLKGVMVDDFIFNDGECQINICGVAKVLG